MYIARLFQTGSLDVHCTLVSGWVCGCALHACFRLGLWMYIARLFQTGSVDSTLHACFRLGLWMCIARLFQAGSVDVHCTLVSGWVCGCALHACFRLGLWMYIARLFQTGSLDVHCTLVSDWVCGQSAECCYTVEYARTLLPQLHRDSSNWRYVTTRLTSCSCCWTLVRVAKKT